MVPVVYISSCRYSVYTYRYFLHSWPHLSYLVRTTLVGREDFCCLALLAASHIDILCRPVLIVAASRPASAPYHFYRNASKNTKYTLHILIKPVLYLYKFPSTGPPQNTSRSPLPSPSSSTPCSTCSHSLYFHIKGNGWREMRGNHCLQTGTAQK